MSNNDGEVIATAPGSKRPKYHSKEDVASVDIGMHEELCSHLTIGFRGEDRTWRATFLHQFYDDLHLWVERLENWQLSLQIDPRTLFILCRGSSTTNKGLKAIVSDTEELKNLFLPITCKFPSSTLYHHHHVVWLMCLLSG